MRVPKTVKEAYGIDSEIGDWIWSKAIAKDMTNLRIEFEKLDSVTPDEIRKREYQAWI